MARVRTIREGKQQVNVHPTEVDAYVQIVTDAQGERYIHISTFGSDDRLSPAKSSQSLQLDEDRALELIRWLTDAFPGHDSTQKG